MRSGLTRWLGPALLLVVVTAVVYIPAATAGFAWDDDAYVTRNEVLHSLGGLRQIWLDAQATPRYQPLVYTSLWLEDHLWDFQPVGYHVVSILLHALGAVLLWRVLARLAVPAAWFCALLFAVHPVHVESVAWIAERRNVLSGCFYFAAALAYLRFAGIGDSVSNRRALWYLASILLFALGLLSKTGTCTLPAALVVVLWWKRGRIAWADVGPLLPMAIVGAGFGLVALGIERQHGGAVGPELEWSPIERVLIAGRAVWFYLGKLIWPADLAFVYPRWRIDVTDWMAYAHPATVLAAIAMLWWLRRQLGRAPLACALLFAGMLLPTLGVFDTDAFRYSFVADHFQYLASVGALSLMVGGGYRSAEQILSSRRPALFVPLVIVGAILGALSFRQARVYSAWAALWEDAVSRNAETPLALVDLGSALERQGKAEEAMYYYQRALEVAPDSSEAHGKLGRLLLDRGEVEESLWHSKRVVHLKPGDREGWYNASVALERLGRTDEAADYARKAQELKQEATGPLLFAADSLQEEGKFDEAIEQYRKALAVDPESIAAHYNMGLALWRSGRVEEAVQSYERALELKPDLVEAHHNLANVLKEQGLLDEAIVHYRAAVETSPRFAEAHHQLGDALRRRGLMTEAIAEFEKTIQVNPKHAAAMNALGWIMATHPGAALHDPARAVALAQRAGELTENKSPMTLDTLAAAYAALGRFDEARQTAEQALRLAEEIPARKLAAEIRERLKLYEQGQAYRSPNGEMQAALRE